jgi:hypothetical protein
MALFFSRFEGHVRDFDIYLQISLSTVGMVGCTGPTAHCGSLSLSQRLSLSFKQVPFWLVQFGFL